VTSVLIVGSGGHAAVLIAALQAANIPVTGCLDQDKSRHGCTVLGVDVLGGDNIAENGSNTDVILINGIGCTLNTQHRQIVFEKFRARNYRFMSVIHPSVVDTDVASLGDGVQVMAGAVLQPRVHIGVNSIVNTGAIVDHDCILGDHVHISPGVTLSGGVSVGNAAMIGAGATIIQGVTIGENAFIAAGATVVSDVEADTRVGGTPARVF